MKKVRPFLVICIALMAIASVAGVISFVSASKDGRLSRLYKEEKPLPLKKDTNSATTLAVAATDESKTSEVEAKTSTRTATYRRKKVKLESFSRAAIEVPIVREGKMTVVDTVLEK